MRCYGCQAEGHIEPNCPNTAIDDNGNTSRPPYCGFCDRRTRLIDHGETVTRCQECHPLARKQLKQHIWCPGCRMVVYAWDTAPCGQHSGPDVPDRRPDRKRILKLVTAERST